MLRLCARVVAPPVRLFGLPTAQEVDTTMMLVCEGTVTVISKADAKPTPASVSLAVNLTNRTAHGFIEPAKMTAVDDTSIIFSNSDEQGLPQKSVTGSLDRVTGNLWALVYESWVYELKCRPAQRMF